MRGAATSPFQEMTGRQARYGKAERGPGHDAHVETAAAPLTQLTHGRELRQHRFGRGKNAQVPEDAVQCSLLIYYLQLEKSTLLGLQLMTLIRISSLALRTRRVCQHRIPDCPRRTRTHLPPSTACESRHWSPPIAGRWAYLRALDSRLPRARPISPRAARYGVAARAAVPGKEGLRWARNGGPG